MICDTSELAITLSQYPIDHKWVVYINNSQPYITINNFDIEQSCTSIVAYEVHNDQTGNNINLNLDIYLQNDQIKVKKLMLTSILDDYNTEQTLKFWIRVTDIYGQSTFYQNKITLEIKCGEVSSDYNDI